MFGYIRPSKPHLSEQDEARFQSVYCGLCHELGRKYGFAARFVLNFDFTFLAILLSERAGASDGCEPGAASAAHRCKSTSASNRSRTVALGAGGGRESWCSAWWQLQRRHCGPRKAASKPSHIAARGALCCAACLPQGEPPLVPDVRRVRRSEQLEMLCTSCEREHAAPGSDQCGRALSRSLLADIADCVEVRGCGPAS